MSLICAAVNACCQSARWRRFGWPPSSKELLLTDGGLDTLNRGLSQCYLHGDVDIITLSYKIWQCLTFFFLWRVSHFCRARNTWSGNHLQEVKIEMIDTEKHKLVFLPAWKARARSFLHVSGKDAKAKCQIGISPCYTSNYYTEVRNNIIDHIHSQKNSFCYVSKALVKVFFWFWKI